MAIFFVRGTCHGGWMLHWGCFWGLWGSGPDPLLRLKSLRSKARALHAGRWPRPAKGPSQAKAPWNPSLVIFACVLPADEFVSDACARGVGRAASRFPVSVPSQMRLVTLRPAQPRIRQQSSQTKTGNLAVKSTHGQTKILCVFQIGKAPRS